MLTKELVEYVANIDETIEEADFISALGSDQAKGMYMDYSEIHDCNIIFYLSVINDEYQEKLINYINRTFPRPPRE